MELNFHLERILNQMYKKIITIRISDEFKDFTPFVLEPIIQCTFNIPYGAFGCFEMFYLGILHETT